jgi:hypothetical protein
MKTMSYLKIFSVILLFSLTHLNAASFSSGILAGYNGGPGIYLNGEVSDFARNFPFKMRVGFGYTSITNPGKSLDARAIFINNNTNGSPRKKGHAWNMRMDLMYKVNWLSLPTAYFYGGPRYASFTGNFNFVGGNEDFDVVSDHWGVGVGIINYFPISKTFDLLIDLGSDYYIPSTMTGHDTSYSPDNENINSREDYKFEDADEAVNQPKYDLRLMMGLNYHF